MSVALKLYEQLIDAGEDKTRAKLIAEAFEQFEERRNARFFETFVGYQVHD